MVPMRGQPGFRPWWADNPSYMEPGYVSLYASRHGADMSGQQTGKQLGFVNDSGMAPMPDYGPKGRGLSVDSGMGFGQPNATLGQMMPPGAYQPDLTREDRHGMRLGGLMSYYRGNV